jgi:hypothetical protein
MGVGQSISAALVFLTSLLPASCHKQKPPPPAPLPAQTNVVVDPALRDLGQLWLTNHSDVTLRFISGEDCTFSSKLVGRDAVQIDISLETKNEYGETRHFYGTQITAPTGKPVKVAVGELKLLFTPLVSTNE